MKRILILLLIFCASPAFAQINYVTEKNIPYYTDAAAGKDDYLASLCLLDIYYPKNVKDFATIVWFHGGGADRWRKGDTKSVEGQGIRSYWRGLSAFTES